MSSLARQRGAALMAMLVVLILGAAWWAVTALSTPVDRTASERLHNARILQEAKSALLGYVAHRAAMTSENNPGRLPCPEALGFIGTANEGIASPNCTLPAVGRLPWRTLGLDKWRDIAGEPLWYVVSPAWALSNSTVPPLTTFINSNSTGQLTLDGGADVVALIIAPGRPLQISASAGCTARVQRRTTPSPAIDLRDYLECENATSPADAAFVSTGPADSFNDQVLVVTGAEMLPGIEAAVAWRFEQQIAPILRNVYSGVKPAPDGSWPADPALPFAATFADPSTSSFKGANATFGGLLPLTYSTDPATGIDCNPVGDARCDPNFVLWRTGAPAPTITGPNIVAGSETCSVSADQKTVTCSFRATYLAVAPAQTTFTISHRATNVGMSLRQLDTTVAMNGVLAAGRTASGVLNNDGSATIAVDGTTEVAPPGNLIGALLEGLLCGLGGLGGLLFDCATHTVSVPIAVLADHPLVQNSAATNPQHWFLRNGWHQVSYYAVAPTIAPAGAAPRSCVSGGNCLSVAFRNPGNTQRGLLVISGRTLNSAARPNGTLTDWLEGTNCDLAAGPPPNCAPDTAFAARTPPLMINRTFNDRVAVIDSN